MVHSIFIANSYCYNAVITVHGTTDGIYIAQLANEI